MRCPLCEQIVFLRNRLQNLLSGIARELHRESFMDYGEIINETVTWSLYQEKYHKYSAPVKMEHRVLKVIDINFPDVKVSEDELKMISNHVLEILTMIHNENNGISEGFDKQVISFDDKKYWTFLYY